MDKSKIATPQAIAPRLLGVRATAQYLGATVWAVRSLAWGRAVPSLKIGNRVLFDKADLDAYVESKKSEVVQ